MTHETAYGLWGLVILNSIIFIWFAFSFFKPQTKTDWRTFSTFSAFIVALFVEMYGFPLTIYLLTGWLGSKYPQLDLLTHDSGHLWHTLFGMKGDPHFDVFHILSNIFILVGFLVLASSWRILYNAQKKHALATTGAYAYVRHPQYLAFILVMLGFLLQWPTLITLVMFPILVWRYVSLAKKEEADVSQEFGQTYVEYAKKVPRFFPRLKQGDESAAAPFKQPHLPR